MYPARAYTLLDQAKAIAQAKFSADTGGRNKDKVCVVAMGIASSSDNYALFSGAPGYTELTELVRGGGDRNSAQQTITNKLTEFLRSESGGSFTPAQITNRGLDQHGRGAMNCAEPKMYYLLKEKKQLTVRNYVLIPFNLKGDTLVYNAPCRNCRRWVYKHFHALSGLIAQSQKGPEAFED